MTDPPAQFNRFRGLVLKLLSLVAIVLLVGGCGDSGANENGFSLETAVADIVAALQRASDCGDINPVLTTEQATAALREQFEMSDGLRSFEEFVLEQVEFVNELADMQCGTQSNENGTENENGSENGNGNG